MNDQANTLNRLVATINKGSSGAIVLPSNPTGDATAAACSLYLGLTKMGKTITLICANPPNMDLTASDKIQSQFAISGDSFVASFPYTDGSIDKVDYNIQGNSFNFIVTPRQGFPKLDPKQVKYSYTGGIVDFIIVIDSATLNNLGPVYLDNQTQFQGKDIINVDRHLTNSFYGTINYVNKTSSSVSELALKILQGLQVEIDRDMATNLYAGIASATNNFSSYSVSADTFENIASLLRFGAVKKTLKKPGTGTPSFPSSYPSSYPPYPSMTDSDEPDFMPSPQPPRINKPFSPPQNREKQVVTPIESVEKETKPEQPTPPQDWLKPKIFRGGGFS